MQISRLLALGSRMTLYGGGRAAEHRGGHVRFIAVRRGALCSAEQVARMAILKDQDISLPRILCVVEPHADGYVAAADADVGAAGAGAVAGGALESHKDGGDGGAGGTGGADGASAGGAGGVGHLEWPDQNLRQYVWRESIQKAGEKGKVAQGEAKELRGGDKGEDEGEAASEPGRSKGSTDPSAVLRLGSVALGREGREGGSGGSGGGRLAFVSMPSARFAHAARHELAKAETGRAKQAMEKKVSKYIRALMTTDYPYHDVCAFRVNRYRMCVCLKATCTPLTLFLVPPSHLLFRRFLLPPSSFL